MSARTSIKSIAVELGVSASTVSRALNGREYVEDDTRRRVLEAAERLNYQPNIVAKSLKNGRSDTLCLMVPSIENLIFPPITLGVEDVARKSGFTVVLCNTGEDDRIEQSNIEKMKNRLVGGFVLCTNSKLKNAQALRAEGFPVVMLNRFDREDIDLVDTIEVDNFRAAYQATQYLLQRGRRRIALVCGSEELLLYRERKRGYLQALADAGVPMDERLLLYKDGTTDDLHFGRIVADVMSLESPPDAFFCTSDPKAYVVLHALHSLKVSIPRQVAVIGFDDVALSAMVEPPLSTMAQPLYEMGAAAAESLMRQIRYKEENGALPPPVRKIMDVTLTVRDSTD